MGRHKKTLRIIEVAREVLEDEHPMTVRQVYYRLVSGQVIKNTLSQYKAVCNALRDARKEGIIPWEWIEDRLRRPREISMWADLSDFSKTAGESYRRNVWAEQSCYVECWLEKDALSGIFEDVLRPYGVTLNVGRGYDGWASIRNAAGRYRNGDGVSVLYFGDFDPSGEDMVRSLRERLSFFEARPEIVKCALNPDDIARYKLPSDFAKASDTRSAAFITKYGDVAVELDALAVSVLKARIVAEVESRMDLDALDRVLASEEAERGRLVAALRQASCPPPPSVI